MKKSFFTASIAPSKYLCRKKLLFARLTIKRDSENRRLCHFSYSNFPLLENFPARENFLKVEI
jgi:hypothetical protein